MKVNDIKKLIFNLKELSKWHPKTNNLSRKKKQKYCPS